MLEINLIAAEDGRSINCVENLIYSRVVCKMVYIIHSSNMNGCKKGKVNEW